MNPTLHQTHISFIPSRQTFPFLKYGYWKFDLQNPRSRSWVRSKFKVTTWVQHPMVPHPFGSMSIHPLIAMIKLFLKMTFKIQGQSHSSQSHTTGRYNTLSTHIPFVPCWSALQYLRYSYLKIALENLRSRSWVRSDWKVTMWDQHLIDSHPFVPSHSWETAFSKFDLEYQGGRS